MLFKSTGDFNRLVKVFDHDGFALYNFKSKGPQELTVARENNSESLLFSLKAGVTLNDTFLEEKDMAYAPPGTELELLAKEDCVVFIARARASVRYDSYVKRYRAAKRMQIGQQTFKRTVVVSMGERDPANSFIAGYVEDSFGEWSSYPPHRHDDRPEAYMFYGIDPGFAVQVVMDGNDELAYVVHDYDTVLIPKGYHPHVSTSLKGSSYAWVMSAPPENRTLNVEIHPAFKGVELGRSHLTIKQ